MYELTTIERKSFETYQTYLAMKTHFMKDAYDFFKAGEKIRAKYTTFTKRKDKPFFYRLAGQYSSSQIRNFFLANFADMDVDSQEVWIANIINYGEKKYRSWQKRIQSLSYTFKEDSHRLFDKHKVDEVFECPTRGHPLLMKSYLSGDTSLETMVIYDQILGYRKDFDKKMEDPVWKSHSMKIKKYSPFLKTGLNIDVFRYKKILKQVVGV